MPNNADQVVSLLTDVAGAVGDIEQTLQAAPSHEKKAAAMTALQDAINIAAKNAPSQDTEQLKATTSKAVDLVVQLNNVMGIFKKGKRQAAPAKKSA